MKHSSKRCQNSPAPHSQNQCLPMFAVLLAPFALAPNASLAPEPFKPLNRDQEKQPNDSKNQQ